MGCQKAKVQIGEWIQAYLSFVLGRSNADRGSETRRVLGIKHGSGKRTLIN